jgi:hypothetical protein
MPHDYLRRLADASYRGTAAVHWSMTIAERRTGWLDTAHHAAMRELLLHTLARYHLACPVYCLMPDHGHFLWLGASPSADQRKAAAFFRRHWNLLLRARGCELQLQGYDHVLREEERKHGAFAAVATYILENRSAPNLRTIGAAIPTPEQLWSGTPNSIRAPQTSGNGSGGTGIR